MASAPDQSLGTRTMRGMFWAYGAYVGSRSVVLVSTAILARLVTPTDFGVVALALVFMTFSLARLPGDPNCAPEKPGRDIYQVTFTGSSVQRFGLPSGYEGTSMATPKCPARLRS
jgi:hypothetical protein